MDLKIIIGNLSTFKFIIDIRRICEGFWRSQGLKIWSVTDLRFFEIPNSLKYQ